MNITIQELEELLRHTIHHSLHQEFAAMKQDLADKFAALTASQNDQTAKLATITATEASAEALLDGLVSQIGAGAATDPEVLAALDAAKAQLDAKNVEIQALNDKLAAKVVADTPA